MNLVVLGAPGAGKGAQSFALSEYFGLTHVSTGDMLRDEMKRKTDVGISVTERMNKGELVPDDVVTELLKDFLRRNQNENGVILDGYPRNLNQAVIMEDFIKIDRVISVNVEDGLIIERMSGRLVCPSCKASFNTHYKPPKVKHICDNCGHKLVTREDDKKKTVKKRLKTYHEETEPIINFYKAKGILTEVNGAFDIETVTKSIIKLLGDD